MCLLSVGRKACSNQSSLLQTPAPYTAIIALMCHEIHAATKRHHVFSEAHSVVFYLTSCPASLRCLMAFLAEQTDKRIIREKSLLLMLCREYRPWSCLTHAMWFSRDARVSVLSAGLLSHNAPISLISVLRPPPHDHLVCACSNEMLLNFQWSPCCSLCSTACPAATGPSSRNIMASAIRKLQLSISSVRAAKECDKAFGGADGLTRARQHAQLQLDRVLGTS